MTHVLTSTIDGLRDFTTRYQQSPFDWLYESDLQASLSETLRHHLKSHPATLEGGLYKPEAYGRSMQLQVSRVKTEYPGGTRFDVAIIDTRKPYTSHVGSDPFWNQPVRVAIELKYCWIGYRPLAYAPKMAADLAKIDKYRREHGPKDLLGVAALFLQEHCLDLHSKFEPALRDVCESSDGPTHCYAIAPDQILSVERSHRSA